MNIQTRPHKDGIEYFCEGHIHKVSFKMAYDIKYGCCPIGLPMVSYGYQCSRVIKGKPITKHCSKHEFGSEPITFVIL